MLALIDIILPVFGITLCGYVAGCAGLLGKDGIDALNRFVYYFALPALLFILVAQAPRERIFYANFLYVWIGALVITYGVTALISRYIYRDSLSIMSMRCINVTFANCGYIGIPLAINAFGEDGALPAVLGVTILAVFVMSTTIFLIETDKSRAAAGEAASKAKILRQIAMALLKNPITIPVAIGVMVPVFRITLPEVVVDFCRLLGGGAIPVTLFSLGVFISRQSLKHVGRQAGLLTFLTLAVHPFAAWVLIETLFPLEPVWAASTVMSAAMPAGATAFVIAQRYQVFVAETSANILLSTVLSVGSVSVLLLLLGVT
jgi:predicted permease